MNKYINLIIGLSIFLGACNLQQDIDLELPTYDSEYVVESYLQVGQPFFLTLTRSQPYFNDIEIEFVRDADVTITHEGRVFDLEPQELALGDPNLIGLGVDTMTLSVLRPLLGDTVVFYASIFPVPESYDTDFDLKISLPDGEELSATTQILRPVMIDSLVQQQNDNDTLSLLLTFFTDDGAQADYYRRVLEVREERERTAQDGTTSTERVTSVEQDFITDDAIYNGQPFAFGTGFQYAPGDTLINTLYHMTFDHFRYIETRDAAVAASLSPFGQPAVISSNIKGGLGIFTGISFDQQIAVIGQ